MKRINRINRMSKLFALRFQATVLCLAAGFLSNTIFCLSGNAQDASPEKLLPLIEARQFMLNLINKDRARGGLQPVKLDRIATLAGQRHAEECSQNLYLAHWDLLGRKPWERYVEAGGRAASAENVAFMGLYSDGLPVPDFIPLLPNQMFPQKKLQEMEAAMFNEKPPNDGHRVNILDPHHTSVGIGLAVASDGQFTRVTLDQEFLNDYGRYEDLPARLSPHKPILVSGTIKSGYEVSLVEVRWEPTPKAMTAAQLNNTESYGYPETKVGGYWAPPLSSPVPIDVKPSGEFSLDIPALSRASPGIYYILIWAHSKRKPEDQFVASVRTLSLGPRATLLAMAHPHPKLVSPAISGTTVAVVPGKPSAAAFSSAAGTVSGNIAHSNVPSTLPDLTKLYFHPELTGGTVISATVGRGGGLRPVDMSPFFAKPTLPDALPADADRDADESDRPDNSKLFFHPPPPK